MEKAISHYFASVKDPRVEGRCDHLLSDILLIAICTYLVGGSDYQDMVLFGKERGKSLEGLLVLPNGVPSHDTFARVFSLLDSSSLEKCLSDYGKDILEVLSEKQIAIDGKKLRGVSPTTRGNAGLYILNAWVCENGLCIAQQKVEDKSNEITAIPKILDMLDIEDAVISIDAIGCQTKIAEQIVKKKGHYLLSVKANQQELFEDVECAFKVNSGITNNQQWEYDHGRFETRTCSILPAQNYLLEETLKLWKNVSTLVRIESVRETKSGISMEVRYYISDEQISNAAYFNQLARGHWRIENNLHWHLDVTFKEDACRARAGNAPQNLSTIRKIALQIITEQKDKLSLKKRQLKAALNNQYLMQLLIF
jgi:predicted transposase YbfD/YdcC